MASPSQSPLWLQEVQKGTQLPEELELELWQDIESIEGERGVKYVTSVERLAIARGERIGTSETRSLEPM